MPFVNLPKLKDIDAWKCPPIPGPGIYLIAEYDGADWRLRGLCELAQRFSEKTGCHLKGLYGRWIDDGGKRCTVNLRGRHWVWRKLGFPVIQSEWTRNFRQGSLLRPWDITYIDEAPAEDSGKT